MSFLSAVVLLAVAAFALLSDGPFVIAGFDNEHVGTLTGGLGVALLVRPP